MGRILCAFPLNTLCGVCISLSSLYHPNTIKVYLSSPLLSRQFTKTAYFSIECTVVPPPPLSLSPSLTPTHTHRGREREPSNFRFSYCSLTLAQIFSVACCSQISFYLTVVYQTHKKMENCNCECWETEWKDLVLNCVWAYTYFLSLISF
jgi:hypothetical protein